MIEKYGKDGGGFDLDDLDEDFDALGIDELSCGESDEEWNKVFYLFCIQSVNQHVSDYDYSRLSKC